MPRKSIACGSKSRFLSYFYLYLSYFFVFLTFPSFEGRELPEGQARRLPHEHTTRMPRIHFFVITNEKLLHREKEREGERQRSKREEHIVQFLCVRVCLICFSFVSQLFVAITAGRNGLHPTFVDGLDKNMCRCACANV